MRSDIKEIIEKFLHTTGKKPLLVLLGPTASGKTALSIEIANAHDGEIISADSRQVYKYMDIGTDKIPLEKREGISHHMIDVVNPDERFTVGDFKQQSEKIIEEIHNRGKVPMIVGGTGFYIEALTKNFILPSENLEVRAELMRELEEIGAEKMHEKLKKLDPENAKKIHFNNIPYVLRALEIILTTGHPKMPQRKKSPYEVLQIGLSIPREELFTRIEKRVDDQIKRGLIDETKKLLTMGFSKNLSSMSSLGYKEIIDYLENKRTLEQAAEEIKKNTRNYAKRQMTWFRRDKEIVWLS